MLPVLFTLPGGYAVHTYGFALGCVMLISVFGAIRLGRSEGVKTEAFYDLSILTTISAALGSRLEYVRTHWAERFADDPMAILDFRAGGYVFFGGLITAVTVDLLYLRYKKLPIGVYADLGAIFIALGIGITRLGCFGAGCCYGLPSDLPWAVTFPVGAIAPPGIPLHPTQLYESAYAFGLAGLAAWWRTRRSFPGEVLLLFGVLYSPLRFLNEGLRGDGERGWAIEGVLTNGQATGLAVMLGCALVWVFMRVRASRRS